jgi:hypothetical protein
MADSNIFIYIDWQQRRREAYRPSSGRISRIRKEGAYVHTEDKGQPQFLEAHIQTSYEEKQVFHIRFLMLIEGLVFFNGMAYIKRGAALWI